MGDAAPSPEIAVSLREVSERFRLGLSRAEIRARFDAAVAFPRGMTFAGIAFGLLFTTGQPAYSEVLQRRNSRAGIRKGGILVPSLTVFRRWSLAPPSLPEVLTPGPCLGAVFLPRRVLLDADGTGT